MSRKLLQALAFLLALGAVGYAQYTPNGGGYVTRSIDAFDALGARCTDGQYPVRSSSRWVCSGSAPSSSAGITNSGALVESGIIRPTGVTGVLDNWAPTGIATARTVYVTLSADATLSSIAAGQVDGRALTICNTAATGFTLTLKHDDGATGTAANRLSAPNAADWKLGSSGGGSCVALRYDGTAQRFKFDAKTGTTYPSLVNEGATTLSGVQTDTTSTGTITGYALGANTTVLRFDAAGAVNIHGIAAPTTARWLTICNISGTSTRNLTLVHNSATETTLANRIYGEGSSVNSGMSDVFLSASSSASANNCATLWYDTVISRWRVLSHSGTTWQNAALFNGGFTSNGAANFNNAVNFAHSIQLASEQTFSTIGQSDNITLNASANVFRYTGASAGTFTGFTGGNGGRLLLVVNESPNALTLTHQAASTAANQITGMASADVRISPSGTVVLRYDSSSSKWVVSAMASNQFGGAVTAQAGLTVSGFSTLNGSLNIGNGGSTEQTDTSTSTQVDFALNSTTSVLRYTGAGVTHTGFTGGSTGRILIIQNETSNTVTINNESASSAAANRITTLGSVNVVLDPQGFAILRYDGTLSRWRMMIAHTRTFGTISAAAFSVSGNFTTTGANRLQATTTTAALSGTNNDLAGGLFATRIAASAATTITGLATGAGGVGTLMTFQNISSFNVTLSHEGLTSTAANRFANPNNVDLVLPPGSAAWLWYDTTLSRWRVIGGSGAYSADTLVLTTTWGHQAIFGTAPTPTTCGTSPVVTGTDRKGVIATGAGATACTVTFSRTYTGTVSCTIVPQTKASNLDFNVSATAINMTSVSGSVTYQYDCACVSGSCT
jgi:hypothetical protein